MANNYVVLARKWRPQTFDDVVGQEHITRTLQNALTSGRIAHAFLFIGSRGIGKTTTARVLAKALNCQSVDGPTPTPCGTCDNCQTIAAGTNIDVIEIDGASNNGVENIREIRENIRLVPSRSRKKIYIIDEVHQLSSGAFNALLKTLEEPPPHAVFILATTEAHKIPANIISRCQRYDFRRVSLNQLCELLRRILDAEGMAYSEESLYAIARAADGGIRDAESILDQLMSYCDKEITFSDVFDVLGLVDWRVLHNLCEAILAKDVAAQLRIVEDVVVRGKDLSQFVQEILSYFRNLLVCKTTKDQKDLLALPDEEIAELQVHARKFTLTQLIRLVEQFAELTKDFDSQLAQRIALEALLIRISQVAVEVSVDSVLEKLALLGQGGPVASNTDVAPVPPRASTSPKSRRAPGADEPPMVQGNLATQPESISDTEWNRPKAAATVKVTAHARNLQELWPTVLEQAAGDNLQLRVWFAHAVPTAVDRDTLVLRFSAQQAQSLKVAERVENRQALEAALRNLTDNVVTFRCEVLDEASAMPPESAAGRPPVGGNVSSEDARAALENPHIASVVNIFCGRIVEVKKAP